MEPTFLAEMVRTEPGWQLLVEMGEVKLWSSNYGTFLSLLGAARLTLWKKLKNDLHQRQGLS